MADGTPMTGPPSKWPNGTYISEKKDRLMLVTTDTITRFNILALRVVVSSPRSWWTNDTIFEHFYAVE